jgi:hypothetical protein
MDCNLRFEVFKAANIKMAVFMFAAPNGLVGVYLHHRSSCPAQHNPTDRLLRPSGDAQVMIYSSDTDSLRIFLKMCFKKC